MQECLLYIYLKSDGDVSPLNDVTILGHARIVIVYVGRMLVNDGATRHLCTIKCLGAQRLHTLLTYIECTCALVWHGY